MTTTTKANPPQPLAVRIHDEATTRFLRWYQDPHPWCNAFLYGRQFILDELRRFLATHPVHRIIDVGSGTGHILHWLTQQGYDAIGVEPARQMRTLCQQLFPSVQVIEGYADRLPFPDESADLILAIEVLRYLDRQTVQRTYRSFWRVLKPGGWIFITHVNRYALDGYWIYWHIKQWLANHYPHIPSPPPCLFTTPQEEIAWLHQAGFTYCQAVGRLWAPIRILYWLAQPIGQWCARHLTRLAPHQRYTHHHSAALAGHLILYAQKPVTRS